MSASPANAGTSSRQLAHRLLSGGAAAAAFRIGAIGLNMLLAVVLARHLPPAGFGLYALAHTYLLFGSMLALLGLEQVLVRRVSGCLAGASGDLRSLLGSTLRMVALGWGGVTVLLLLGRGWLLGTDATALAGWLAVWVGLQAINMALVAFLRGMHRLVLSSLFHSLVRNLVLVVLAGVLALRGELTLLTLLMSAAAATGVSVALAALVLWRRLPPRRADGSTAGAGAASVARLWGQSWPLLVATVLGLGLTQADLWLLRVVGGEEELAIYGAVLRLVFLMDLPLLVLNTTVASTIAELYTAGRREMLERVARSSTSLATLPAAVVAAVLFGGGGWVLELLFGDFYRQGAVLLMLLSVGYLLRLATGPCGLMLMLCGHQRDQMLITIGSILFLLTAGLWAGSRYGMVGIAAVSATNLALNNLTTLFVARWRVGVFTHLYLMPWRMLRRRPGPSAGELAAAARTS
ncbi:MAG: lipopolysaccharide biosynthesis protein [Phycisphaeraceae bacterium]